MSYRKRVDGNHSEVIAALRKAGWRVKDTSRYGDGFPDALARRGDVLLFIEIKDGAKSLSRRQLTDEEAEFVTWFGEWPVRASYRVVLSAEDAVTL